MQKKPNKFTSSISTVYQDNVSSSLAPVCSVWCIYIYIYMIGMLTSSSGIHRSDPNSDKIDICCFSAKLTALRSKTKDGLTQSG